MLIAITAAAIAAARAPPPERPESPAPASASPGMSPSVTQPERRARAGDASLRDTGGSLILTFWPSEFSQVRGQYRRTRYAEGETANEFLFQFLYSIGAHGAHPF